MDRSMLRLLCWTTVFAVAFALVEASVVSYLRALYYPSGFVFPLKPMSSFHVGVELARESATIVMLAAVGAIAGTTRWRRFAFFLVAFGVWDVFYYVWLKVFLDWPSSLFDWDILFLIPIPWIGPVIAPAVIAVLMVVGGWILLDSDRSNHSWKPSRNVWICAIIGTALVLITFMMDTGATLEGRLPTPFAYGLFVLGTAFYVAALVLLNRDSQSRPHPPSR